VRGAGFTALVGAGESVVAGLTERGVCAEEVDTLVLSSLRPRHAAGAVRREGGRTVSTFPNATLYVQAAGLLPGSSPREIWEPYAEAGRLAAIEGAHEIGAGLSVLPLPGHDRGTQAVRLHWGGKTAFSFAGVLPTAAHVPIGWIPAHDVYPVELIETKKRLIEQAVREGWLCVFEHDPDVPWGVIVDETNGKRRVHVVALDRAEF
jgi:glyoxylase-like metal-dependent hydrolase (beta-lactamase superfamily II)